MLLNSHEAPLVISFSQKQNKLKTLRLFQRHSEEYGKKSHTLEENPAIHVADRASNLEYIKNSHNSIIKSKLPNKNRQEIPMDNSQKAKSTRKDAHILSH